MKQPEQALTFLINEMFRRSPQIAALATSAREFCRMIRERDVAAWPEWKHSAAAGPLSRSAKHLCSDEAAFLAVLQQLWSNGPVEVTFIASGASNDPVRRANFDLLRLRVIHAASNYDPTCAAMPSGIFTESDQEPFLEYR